MATTYKLIASTTVGSGGAANIDLTSIPATYTDLKLVVSMRTARSGAVVDYIKMTFNNAANSAFSGITLWKNDANSTPSSNTFAGITGDNYSGWVDGASATSSTFGSWELYVPNYTSSNQKSYSIDNVMEQNGTEQRMDLIAGLWSGTSAITSIKIVTGNGDNFVQYTTAYLYGIKNS